MTAPGSDGRNADGKMRLGLFFEGLGHHIAAWRDPSVDATARQRFSHFVEIAQSAERGKFDLIFTADTFASFNTDDPKVWERTALSSRHEPMTLLSALAAVTEHVGLVATMTSTYYEPIHVARLFASLDHISNGRAGWNLVTTVTPAEAYQFGRDMLPDPKSRYSRAREFARVVFGLWDSYEPDAIIADKTSGIYLDPNKLHRLNHKGEHFSVRGPLTIPRVPQGRPIIVQAGASDDGRDLAAEITDIVFSVQQNIKESKVFYDDIKMRVANHGRAPDQVKILPGVMPVVGQTRAEAEDRFERLQRLIPDYVGLEILQTSLGMDLSSYDLDGPLPDPPMTDNVGRRRVIVDMARRENLTIRQLFRKTAGQRSHRVLIGTPKEVADGLEEWFVAGACDGFNLLPATFPEGLNMFVDLVIPELQRRGLFRTEYEGRTLRENLGLQTPKNRWSGN